MTSRNLSLLRYAQERVRENMPRLSFGVAGGQDFTHWQHELIKELKNLLGEMPPKIPFNAELLWEIREEGLIKRKVVFDLETAMAATALIYIPEAALKNPHPAILCHHGHGCFGKDSVMGVRSVNDARRQQEIITHNYDYGLQMARHGYVTIAIDYRGFGERGEPVEPYPGRDKCNVHFIQLSSLGYNLMALDIFDALRTLDYLCEQPFVDPERIGTMGLSLGGVMTMWTALLDKRIKAADVICASYLFRTTLSTGNICGSQYVPGLYRTCDVADLLGLMAPRPLLLEIGTIDACFNFGDAKICAEHVGQIYEAAAAREMFETEIFDSDHIFHGKRAFEFFDKHLKAATASPSRKISPPAKIGA